MANPAPGFKKRPEHKVDLVRIPGRRTRVVWQGTVLADSADVLMVEESGYPPVAYFPRKDVRIDLLTPSAKRTHCPFKGDASYWTVKDVRRVAEDAVWSYEEPFDETAELQGRMAFWLTRLDGARLEND